MRYEIKAVGVGGTLDQAIQLLKNHFGLLIGISACVSIPVGIVLGLVSIAMMPVLPPDPTPQDFAAFNQQLSGSLFIVFAVALLSAIIVYPLTNAAMTFAIASEYLGTPTTIGAAFARAFASLLPLIWTSFLMFALAYLGIFACIIPGVILFFRWALSSQVVILEGRSGFDALGRSKELMTFDRNKNYNTIFLLWLLLGIISLGINFCAQIIPQPHVATVVSVLAQSVNNALFAAAMCVFYFSCRCKADNFDLQRLADAMKEDAAPAGDAL